MQRIKYHSGKRKQARLTQPVEGYTITLLPPKSVNNCFDHSPTAQLGSVQQKIHHRTHVVPGPEVPSQLVPGPLVPGQLVPGQHLPSQHVPGHNVQSHHMFSKQSRSQSMYNVNFMPLYYNRYSQFQLVNNYSKSFGSL